MSDHNPIHMRIDVNVEYLIDEETGDYCNHESWRKANSHHISAYEESLDGNLVSVVTYPDMNYCNNYGCNIYICDSALFVVLLASTK